MQFIQRFFLLIYFLPVWAQAQPSVYTTANAHSHNDYEQALPFWDAYQHGFGSIEADIFLIKDSEELLVAHTPKELTYKRRRLDSLYLLPLVACIHKNGGTVYADPKKKLQLLIDIKTAAVPTLDKLIKTLERFPELTGNKGVQFVISGNRPSSDSFVVYPPFIQFDGELNKTYSDAALSRIVLLSDNLTRYITWNGNAQLPEADREVVLAQIRKAHQLKKPVRFWDAPDTNIAWDTLMKLGVDYINTDKISSLAAFLSQQATALKSNSKAAGKPVPSSEASCCRSK